MTSNPDGFPVSMSQSMMVDAFTPPAQLSPAMDIFAAGYFHSQLHLHTYYLNHTNLHCFTARCSLIELFSEGQPPFDFAQLLAYRSQEMNTCPVLDRMEDSTVRVSSLILLYIVLDSSFDGYHHFAVFIFRIS